MTDTPAVIGQAVLRDYPLRLWQAQQEHTDAVLREFSLLLGGHEAGFTSGSPPEQLLQLAEMFTVRCGPLLTAINESRQQALLDGRDRMDSVVPLVEGLPALLAQVRSVLAAVDEFCNNGELLTLARPPELAKLSEWSMNELVVQYEGGEPTPWPGPF